MPARSVEKYIAEFLRVLKPGGILVFQVPERCRGQYLRQAFRVVTWRNVLQGDARIYEGKCTAAERQGVRSICRREAQRFQVTQNSLDFSPPCLKKVARLPLVTLALGVCKNRPKSIILTNPVPGLLKSCKISHLRGTSNGNAKFKLLRCVWRRQIRSPNTCC